MSKMNRKTETLIIAILLLLMPVSCGMPETAPYPPQQADFAFRFEYGSCTTDILDTFNDTYTRDMIIEPDVTITLRLADPQMAAIYQKMVSIRFFDYPEVFSIPTPQKGLYEMVTPASQYRINVRNGGATKSLSWFDEIVDPKTPEGDKLRELFQLIIKAIEDHPDYNQLPERKAACL